MDPLARLRAYVDEHDLLPSGAGVLVGCSGGPDSLALLDALSRLAGPRGWRLAVACLDHGLRPEAAAEVALVRAAAVSRGWPFHTERVDTRGYSGAAGRRLSLEEAARDLRYQFLADLARVHGFPAVAVAHTADDQAETVLMHFLRGSGLAGLRGMAPASDLGRGASGVRLVRPLLNWTRAQVEAYCQERGLRPVHDPTNQDRAFFRNRLRHELLPALEAYNPNIRAVLARTAMVASGEHALMEEVVETAWRAVAQPLPEAVRLDRAGWRSLGAPAQRALLRRAARHLRPAERDLDFTPLEQAVRFSRRATPGRQCDVLAGLRLRVTATALYLEPWGAQPGPAAHPTVTAAGLAAGWRLRVEPQPAGPDPVGAAAANPDPWRTLVDVAAVPPDGVWEVRGRRPGDRFQPLGLGGRSVKLADFFINVRLAAAERDRWPLVTCGGALVWVAGLRLDERYKVTPTTRQVAALSFAAE